MPVVHDMIMNDYSGHVATGAYDLGEFLLPDDYDLGEFLITDDYDLRTWPVWKSDAASRSSP